MVKRPDLIKRNKERTKEKIKVICPCGKEFFVIPSRIKNGAKYCSQKCYRKFGNHPGPTGKTWKLSKETRKKQGLSQIGEKNHNWKGGITNPRKNKQEKSWARKVKKRDKFCVICGENQKLDAHHLESFDINKEKRYDVNNGITLCKKHHEEFHKKYGYGKNTEKQFKEFITDEIIEIKKILMKKSKIHNLTLEGEYTFFANGIFTHNTAPHTISPKNKKALKFEAGKKQRLERKGKKSEANIVITKEVKHPGTRPNPFIRNVFNNKLRKIIAEEIMRAKQQYLNNP